MMQLQQESAGYRVLTWQEYREKTLSISAFLQAQGVSAGDKVLLISENAPEWTMAALAVLNLGAVVIPVASIASVLEVENISKEANPKFCFLSEYAQATKELKEKLKIPYLLWNIQEEAPLKKLYEKYAPIPLQEAGDGDETAILIFTSGTTGHPKAVPISHKNILTNARDALAEIEPNRSDRLVSVLPLSHMFEFTGGFVTPVLIGAQITYVKSLRAEDLLQAMRDTKATLMLGVPLLFEIIMRNLQSRIQDIPEFLSPIFEKLKKIVREYPFLGPILFYPIHRSFGAHLRYFMAGGSRLQPQVYDFFRDIGIIILQGYGLTETSPVLSVTNLKNSAPDHVGKTMRSIELGIFNDQGEKLAVGIEGEIWARGPSIFKGYANPEHNKDVFFKDWFRTGDLGTLDKEGLLRITGRKKDIIVTSAGKNIYPEEIETIILQTGKFLEACVFGRQDSGGHEKICLVLVPDRAKFLGLSQKEIAHTSGAFAMDCCKVLSDYKWPQKIEVLFNELPKTITKKIKKHEVKKLLQEKKKETQAENTRTDSVSYLDMEDDLERTLAESIATIAQLNPETVSKAAALTTDIGIDSLTFVEIVSAVEKKFAIQLEGIEFASIVTVNDLIVALSKQLGNRRKRKRLPQAFFANFAPFENQKLCWKLPRTSLNLKLRFYLKFRHNIEVYGLENIESGGSFVFAPNHSSHFDTMSIMGSLPVSFVHSTFAVAAKDYFFDRTWKAILSRVFINAIPFDRKGRIDESMEKCHEILHQGGSLVIFPEGTRSSHGGIQSFKPGVGRLLAGNIQTRAIPVYIDGAYKILPKGKGFPGEGKLRVYYGKAISFQHLKPEPESYRKIAEHLQEEVQALEIQAKLKKH